MLPAPTLKRIAVARLRDAQALLKAKRFDGACYICGYAVEMALKARICRTLKWSGFPEQDHEFHGLSSFKIHKLQILLRLSGRDDFVKAKLLADWSNVMKWVPESRYKPPGSATKQAAEDMLRSAAVILKKL